MIMLLFEDKERTDTRPSRYIDNKYDFYDRNNQSHISNVRDILNNWFSKYPLHEQTELKSRFKKDFESALYELYLFNLFIQLGFDITIHPTLPNTTKHPDFLLSKNEIQICVEAKIITGKTKEEKAKEQIKSMLYDLINDYSISNFYFGIDDGDIIFKTCKQPSAKLIISFLENEINNYNYSAPEELYKTVYDDDNIIIPFYIVASKNTKINKYRNIHFQYFNAFHGEQEAIQKALVKKASRYGKIEIPYIVCINTFTVTFFNKEDLIDTIWGSTCQYEDENEIFRLDDGFFGSKKNKKHTRVSGVMINNVIDANLQSANYLLCKNSYSIYDFDFSIMGLDYYSLIENKVVKIISANNKKELNKF